MTAMIPLVPFDVEVSSSVKLMLLQGQLAETVSAAAAAPAPRAPTAAPARAGGVGGGFGCDEGGCISIYQPYPAILNYFDVKTGSFDSYSDFGQDFWATLDCLQV